MPTPLHLTHPAHLHTAFTTPALQVPAAPPISGREGDGLAADGRPYSMAWLRATVARFSSGPDHARRRTHATTALAAIDPTTLRSHTHQLTAAALTQAGNREASDGGWLDAMPEPDVMPELARRIPLTALVAALASVFAPSLVTVDIPAVVAAALTAAPGYLVPPDPPVAEIDGAVADLVGLLGSGDDEVTANRIALLFQASAATGGLIDKAVPRALDPANGDRSTEAVLVEVLRDDPPVRVARRVAVRDTTLAGSVVSAGTPVLLDLAEANRDTDHAVEGAVGGVWTFGFGEHRCPGSMHAIALAAGVVDAVRAHTEGVRR
jgi:cytochrome P450